MFFSIRKGIYSDEDEGVTEMGRGNGLIIEKWEVNRHSVWHFLSLKEKKRFSTPDHNREENNPFPFRSRFYLLLSHFPPVSNHFAIASTSSHTFLSPQYLIIFNFIPIPPSIAFFYSPLPLHGCSSCKSSGRLRLPHQASPNRRQR